MSMMDAIKEQARRAPQRVVFPEGTDELMLRAAVQAAAEGYARPLVVGEPEALAGRCAELGLAAGQLSVVSASDTAYLEDVAARYAALPGTMLGRRALLRRMAADPLYLALGMEAVGDADVTFAGVATSTGEVIMAGQQVIGLAEGVEAVSSVAFGEIPDFAGGEAGAIAFGDAAVVVDPSAEELAGIAISCCDSTRDLMGWEPRCALLSFSTCGSTVNAASRKVAEAVRIAQERRPDLAIDGEFQLDTALDPRIAARKVQRASEVAGRANVVVFPNLDAGNIAVKVLQGPARTYVIGPFLQGFRKVVSDCSRGAGVDAIVGNIAVSCLRAARLGA